MTPARIAEIRRRNCLDESGDLKERLVIQECLDEITRLRTALEYIARDDDLQGSVARKRWVTND